MSIVTRTGDKGTTALMYGRRVGKNHPRVEAYGCVDELTAAIGLARAQAAGQPVQEHLLVVQRDLIVLMGELATAKEDLPRYVQDGHRLVTPELTGRLEELVRQFEAQTTFPKDWAIPGSGMGSATLDLARTICRRAERRVCALQEAGRPQHPEMVIYLNRLADLLWLLARWVENQSPTG
ncbi:MAG TPA: cob(I)yrinic acid a,c-diamide adenosyltransferase [Verrucomicrobiota bacterium]|nr:cob(I)yrinic acid a,c-diamide adenosyltransferase [Verrucomicrobiota bacterium]HNT14218.1 cob(I)yrinic acid a,c-diamide adenosyltransferase [Verrucomicrobiota bacterium]